MSEILLSKGARKRLLSLVTALVGWETAAGWWQRLRDPKVMPGGREYEALATPIVVFYARPFTRCGGLPPLAGYDEFRNAPNPAAFAANHANMLKARNLLFAHIDIPSSQELIEGRAGFARTNFLAVRRENDGTFSFETKSLLPDLVGNLGVPKLLAFQIARLTREIDTTAERLIGRRVDKGEAYRLIDRDARRAGME